MRCLGGQGPGRWAGTARNAAVSTGAGQAEPCACGCPSEIQFQACVSTPASRGQTLSPLERSSRGV